MVGLGLSVRKLGRTGSGSDRTDTQFAKFTVLKDLECLILATAPQGFQRRPRPKLPLILQLSPRVPAAVAHQDRA
jgi:hypothetical protein